MFVGSDVDKVSSFIIITNINRCMHNKIVNLILGESNTFGTRVPGGFLITHPLIPL